MSQVSRRQPLVDEPLLDGFVQLIEAAAQGGVRFRLCGHDLGQARPQQTVVAARAKQDRAPTRVGHSIAMGLWRARSGRASASAAGGRSFVRG